MNELVRHIKFPLHFDVERLKTDVEHIKNDQWKAHYNTKDYNGNWTSLSLFSSDGRSDTIYVSPTIDSKMIPTEILNDCPYTKEILEGFLFKKIAVRLLRLEVNAEVKPHSDHCLGYEDGCFRLHIPIITNPKVEFILDNQRIIMNEGECWYINANFIHSVANHGEEDRIHLVIDGIRNEWTDTLFFQNHSENQFQKPIRSIKNEEKELMIAELRRMNSAAADEIIAKMMKE